MQAQDKPYTLIVTNDSGKRIFSRSIPPARRKDATALFVRLSGMDVAAHRYHWPLLEATETECELHLKLTNQVRAQNGKKSVQAAFEDYLLEKDPHDLAVFSGKSPAADSYVSAKQVLKKGAAVFGALLICAGYGVDGIVKVSFLAAGVKKFRQIRADRRFSEIEQSLRNLLALPELELK